jgi:hypothetical protein
VELDEIDARVGELFPVGEPAQVVPELEAVHGVSSNEEDLTGTATKTSRYGVGMASNLSARQQFGSICRILTGVETCSLLELRSCASGPGCGLKLRFGRTDRGS